MTKTSFEPKVDESYFAFSYEGVFESPDRSRLAGVFTDEDGEWIYVGSFENGMKRIQIDLKPSLEYSPITWLNDSEILYAHYDRLFAIIDVDSGEEQVYGEREGDIRPLGEVDGVLIGLRDNISREPRFEIVGYNTDSDELMTVAELETNSVYFGFPIFLEGSSVYVPDYTESADSLNDHGIFKYTIEREDDSVDVESEFRSIWDDASATPYGFTNKFTIVRKGGLQQERKFGSDDVDEEVVLYNWDSEEVLEFPLDGTFQGVIGDDLVFTTTVGESMELPTTDRMGVLSEVDDTGVVEEIERMPVDAGFRWGWGLIDDGLYGYSHDEKTCVSYYNSSMCSVLSLEDVVIEVEADVAEKIELDIAEGYAARVYALKDEKLDDMDDRPVIICTYPAIDITIRDVFGVELLKRGYLLVNPFYDDGEYYGKTLALKGLVQKLSEREYCGDIGLYGFSAGGTQVLNFAGSAYSDMVDCVLAGCPNLTLGTRTGHDAYMRPVKFKEEAPLLFKDYSPLYRLDQIDLQTDIIEGSIDTRINTVSREEIFERADEEFVSVTEYDTGHGAVRYSDQKELLRHIVEFFEGQLG